MCFPSDEKLNLGMQVLIVLFLLFFVFFVLPALWSLRDESEAALRAKPKEKQGYLTRQPNPYRSSSPSPSRQPNPYRYSNPGATRQRTPSTSQSLSPTLPATQTGYGPPNSNHPHVLRRPVGDCICGCNGVPMTHLAEYSIDYNKYKTCPARKRRKSTGVFINDQGVREVWNEKKVQRQIEKQLASTPEAIAKRQKEVKERERARNEAKRLQRQQEKDRAEAERIAKFLPALSAAEAVRRGLTTYVGKDCAMNHGGIRLLNGECVQCKKADSRLRDAMRRGAYPRTLTKTEKKRIEEIYAECRRRTTETGIEHHVDHIKPLAAGGEHHPDNLQILTASENLSKGAKWDGG